MGGKKRWGWAKGRLASMLPRKARKECFKKESMVSTDSQQQAG